ncbi:MAG: hypothetical protein LCH85_10080 [Chloroflexi bacterium]|nr:hypothetical protein [Chloroflexota bacterium]
MRLISYFLLVCGLVACGGATATPIPATQVVAQVNTATPEPTLVQPTLTPTIPPTFTPLPRVTPTVADLGNIPGNSTAFIQIKGLKTYTNPTQAFSIDVPDDWQMRDSVDAGNNLLFWVDPAEQAFIQLLVVDDSQNLIGDQAEFLNDFISQIVGQSSEFNIDQPVLQADGNTYVSYSFIDEQSLLAMSGDGYVRRDGNYISIIQILVPLEQFEALQPDLLRIVQSYKIDPNLPLQ